MFLYKNKRTRAVGSIWFGRGSVGLTLLGVVLLLSGGSVSAAAATFYVDSVSGSDSNPGTSSSAAWRTLGKVNGVSFQPGDTVNFNRGGVWQGELRIKSNGTATSAVTYQAYGSGPAPQIKNPGVNYGHAISVTGQYNVIRDFLLTDSHEAGVRLQSGADHNTVTDNEVSASGTGVMADSRYNLITKNYVHDLKMIVNDASPSNDYGAVCFWLNAGNNEISYNRGVNCIASSYDFGSDGGFVEVFNGGDNEYIHHNWAENTEGFFELGGNSSSASAANVIVAYNVIANPANGAVCLNTGNYNINVSNFRFENNTFVSTGGHGYRVFYCRSDFSSLQVRNNIFYSNIQIANNGNFLHSNNVYQMVNMINGSGVGYQLGSGEKVANPLFSNLGGKDYHLQAGSPAIDLGLSLGYATDFGGNSVPIGSAPDIGAYEFGSVTNDTTPPSVPTGLLAIAVSPSQINLTWNAATDNVAVAGYRVLRGGIQIASVAASITSYSDTALVASTAYSYTVEAYDAAGNESAKSALVSATTLSTTPPVSSANLARGIVPTSKSGFTTAWGGSAPQVITDGVINSSSYGEVSSGAQWVQIDLGAASLISKVKLWHFFNDGRTYHDVIVQLSNDPTFSTGVITVFNNDSNNSAHQGAGSDAEYVETGSGKEISFSTISARYVRTWTNGSSQNAGNHYVEIQVFGTN
jgi:hypothetical protein